MADLDSLCILDVETTGLNPTTDEVIELGCILYSLSHNCVLQQVSALMSVTVDESPTEGLNGISAKAANSVTKNLEYAGMAMIDSILLSADVAVAHNAAFDKSFVEASGSFDHINLPWIDTRAIQWPRATRQGCNLVELALSYGVPVWSNHRALTDCQLLAHIIEREPMAAQLMAKELEPKVWATWRSTPDDVVGRNKAKAAGFRWKDERCPANGVWSRLMHPDDVMGLGFEVVVVDTA